VLRGLVGQWYEDGDYSYGFAVPIFSAYLIRLRRDTLAMIPRKPASFGLLVVLGAQVLHFLGSLGAELFLTRVSMIFTICGLVIYFLGWTSLRAVVFPLGFLFLMIPLPTILYNEIVFPLQFLASRFATSCLKTTGIVPVVREGNLLILPNYTLELVEACSGIRSLMSLEALAIAYGYLAEKRMMVRIVLVAAMVPVAVMSNGFRVMITAILTRFWGLQAADGFLHSFSGWVLFLAATTCLLLIHGLITRAGDRWQRRALA
jgi:exosortase